MIIISRPLFRTALVGLWGLLSLFKKEKKMYIIYQFWHIRFKKQQDVMTKRVSPWCNRNGWLGVKHQVTTAATAAAQSVQFKMVLCLEKAHSYALHLVFQRFPRRCLWKGSSIRLMDDGPLPFASHGFCSPVVHGRSSSLVGRKRIREKKNLNISIFKKTGI